MTRRGGNRPRAERTASTVSVSDSVYKSGARIGREELVPEPFRTIPTLPLSPWKDGNRP
ncbi:hypothetical protein ACF064_02505 [Streptomyces sp. NPDC015492]|uniref:hypothetical protein n=1 Tax=Streptomyces sp. NPDC015492 TaxID=3364958 RepID=UPI0036FD4CAA